MSCPNVEDRSRMFAHSAEATGRVLAATACAACRRWAKLSPNVPDLVEIAQAARWRGGRRADPGEHAARAWRWTPRPVAPSSAPAVAGCPVRRSTPWPCAGGSRSAAPPFPTCCRIVGVGGVILGLKTRSSCCCWPARTRRPGGHGHLPASRGRVAGCCVSWTTGADARHRSVDELRSAARACAGVAPAGALPDVGGRGFRRLRSCRRMEDAHG